MAANFVILYGSKVGSTAIISSLSAQPGIRVPLLEDLDKYRFKPTKHLPSVSRALRDVFETGRCLTPNTNQMALKDITSDQTLQSIGFKWRFWGILEKHCALFKEKNVLVFILSRKDFLELCCAFYIQKYGEKHLLKGHYAINPQFAFFNHGKNQNKQLLQDLRKQEFHFDQSDFLHVVDIKLEEMERHAEIAHYMNENGVQTCQIYYEDFDTDPVGFIEKFLKTIKFKLSQNIDPFCAFSKTHTSTNASRIKGLESLLKDGQTRQHFERALEKFHSYSAQIAALTRK